MNAQQIDTLTEITRLALSASNMTGMTVYHDVVAWPMGDVWSMVRTLDGLDVAHNSRAVIWEDGNDSIPEYDACADRCTLLEQRDALAKWIAANRKQEVA